MMKVFIRISNEFINSFTMLRLMSPMPISNESLHKYLFYYRLNKTSTLGNRQIWVALLKTV